MSIAMATIHAAQVILPGLSEPVPVSVPRSPSTTPANSQPSIGAMSVVRLRSHGGPGAWAPAGRMMPAVVVSSPLYTQAFPKTVLLAPLRLETELYGRHWSKRDDTTMSRQRPLRPALELDAAAAQRLQLRPGRHCLCLDSLQAIARERIVYCLGALPAMHTQAVREALDALLPGEPQGWMPRRALPDEVRIGNAYHTQLGDVDELGGKDRYALVLTPEPLQGGFPVQQLIVPISTCPQQPRAAQLRQSLPRTLLDEPRGSYRKPVHGNLCLDQLRTIETDRLIGPSRGVVPKESVARAMQLLRRLLA